MLLQVAHQDFLSWSATYTLYERDGLSWKVEMPFGWQTAQCVHLFFAHTSQYGEGPAKGGRPPPTYVR